MRQEPELKIDLVEIEAALRRAARDAVSGTREQRSGRFLRRDADADRWGDQVAREVEAEKPDQQP